ncbi:hypothetical protein XACW160_470028 [Xanthomonas citri pv. citri]|uniref:Uncharacterized protein n=1 Tax=Xanthomonas citri pv. citri TaxID=611301 RepID=A0A0U5FEH8_XANCI|nr:hypothetical protein XAC9322_480021 [Xanthomonas citri pv. citri]CEE31143.1 hypothetical protein XAC1083_470017 [Xanthomonas citri pv. citri]CEE42533.1 hypothetical protein XAC902_650010 [Xanthomonas citri pv. citri]CEE43431.1 hypothetical protein XAC2911_540017 [Xanthomonas citri pv. citri]CEE51772.1 hypothetical protein XAC3608_1010017 [Xanthomonas citri pv. citri]
MHMQPTLPIICLPARIAQPVRALDC